MNRYIDADELLKYLSVMYDRQNDEDEKVWKIGSVIVNE